MQTISPLGLSHGEKEVNAHRDGQMNWTRALHDIITHEDHPDRNALTAALALDTVYMPSELAARLLPLDVRRTGEPATWNRSVQGGDLRSPAH